MSLKDLNNSLNPTSTPSSSVDAETQHKPSVTVLTPAYNEAALIQQNLARLCTYLESIQHKYDWTIQVVNDGSKDNTAQLADAFAAKNPRVKIHHHKTNKNLGGALRTGFGLATTDYIVVMDLDLSYAEDHIEKLLDRLVETDGDIVVASPYMKGGKNTAVPWLRLLLSRVVNRIMRFMAPQPKIHTFTGMVRGYKTNFIKKLNLKSNTYSIMPEIIYKGLVLRARIEEIPAHLDWSLQNQVSQSRTSSIKILKGISAGLMSGFIFRPYIFFMAIGLVLFAIAFYIIIWIFINTISVMPEIPEAIVNLEGRFGPAVARVFSERPYSFFVGGIALIVSFQFLAVGFLSLQNKRYFEELFHMNTHMINRKIDLLLKEQENNK